MAQLGREMERVGPMRIPSDLRSVLVASTFARMANGEDGKLTTWTLGAIKNRNMAVEGYCETEGCGHFYVFDIDRLIEGSGAGYLVPEYLPGITCSACGGRLKFMLAMMLPEE